LYRLEQQRQNILEIFLFPGSGNISYNNCPERAEKKAKQARNPSFFRAGEVLIKQGQISITVTLY